MIPNNFTACLPYLQAEEVFSVTSISVRLHITRLRDYQIAKEIDAINHVVKGNLYSERSKVLAKRMKRLYINELRYRKELSRKMQNWSNLNTITLYLRDYGA